MEQGYLREANLSDKDILFQWANEPMVRRNSFSTQEITYEEHEKWFQYQLERKDGRQYIYMYGECPVGQVRVTLEQDVAEIGYSICAEQRRKGYGRNILQLILQQIKCDFPEIKKVCGRVKSENLASQKAFLSAGYQEKYCMFEADLE